LTTARPDTTQHNPALAGFTPPLNT